jgi:hypothetical protein
VACFPEQIVHPLPAKTNLIIASLVDEERQVGGRINPHPYFECVPRITHAYHVGGYPTAQISLKDHKGHAPSFDDVMHYQKIIKILTT